MPYSRRNLSARALALVGLYASSILAAPSVNVALKASFNAAPYLVELIETAAEENSTAYFPLLDRVAEGHFDNALTDRDLHTLFLQTLQDDGHLSDPEALSSFQLALSIHSTAPRIEAHHQYYTTGAQAPKECESWVHFDGKQYCTPDLASSTGEPIEDYSFVKLPFDRVLGDQSKPSSILYADITSESFRKFHKTISLTAKSGKTSYRVRYKPSASQQPKPLLVSGYGIELALKRTDYIVIDDRPADETGSDGHKSAVEATLAEDDDVTDLRPLSSSDLLKLGLKATTFVAKSANRFETLLRLTQDFPKHSAAIAATNVSQDVLAEHTANHADFLPSGYNALWINGLQVIARDFDAFAMLEHLRRERKLVRGAKDLGLTGPEAIDLLSHSAIAEASGDQDQQRYDWRDEIEGGNIIIWLNNIEKDKRYDDWPAEARALLQRTYPGQLPAVRKDIHNVILPTDFSNYKDVELVIENIQNFVKRGVPIRFGLVPRIDTPAAVNQAKVVYHLLDTYGIGAALSYLEVSLAGQGRKFASPVQSLFDQTIKGHKLRRDKTALSFQEVLHVNAQMARLDATKSYLTRLGATGVSPPYFANGVAIERGDDWMQSMSNRVGIDLRVIQQAVYLGQLTDDNYLPETFLAGAAPRRNALVIPENEKDVRLCNMAELSDLGDGHVGQIPSVPASVDTIELELVQLIVAADFDSPEGGKLFHEAITFRQEHDNVELFVVHNPGTISPASGFSETLFGVLEGKTALELSDLASLTWSEPAADGESSGASTSQRLWASAASILGTSGIGPGHSGIILNGRIVGPLPESTVFNKDDFDTLLSYERKKRLVPAAAAFRELSLNDKAATPYAFARLSNLVAQSMVSDVPEGIFDSPPTVRTANFKDWQGEHTLVEVGDKDTATIQVVASIDPASETAQRWVPILKVLSELSGVNTKIYLNPKDRLDELPVKRFYRHVLQSQPSFDEAGVRKGLKAEFGGLPAEALLTMAMDVPPAWLVSPQDSVHDLDNIKLSSLKGGSIDATYELEHILIEGHSKDVTLGPPPRGAQLVLGTGKDNHFADTIIMSNLGYFQFKANPGFYNLSLQKGRSQEIFNIDSAGTLGQTAQPGDETTEIALTSFRGSTLFPRLSRKPGMDEQDVLEASKSTMDGLAEKAGSVLSKIGIHSKDSGSWLSKASKISSSFMSGDTAGTDVQTLPHADINIFSVASGHLYERMLNIMMVSVMKHTSHTVKFWFIEQFLSPSFKAFLPLLAEEYGFRYEMVTYKWPHWLRAQKEKQREIWGYKILFLDVLFPLDLDKVIFVDADQIVRTDMYELVQYDLQGAPYGFTPMCDSRTEMEGFRFWKQGYWKTFLRGAPYHISALYVVDLVLFRQMAAGDRLRQQYHQLSADPNSLSNLDQDLPNHMQHVLPIHSLPQEWLWCETWCSDESLGVARTIDLCNNPQTKEPKLERARRQVPEWNIYDEEIAALAKRKSKSGQVDSIAGGGDSMQEQLQKEEAERHKANQLEEKRKEGKDDSDGGRTRDEL